MAPDDDDLAAVSAAFALIAGKPGRLVMSPDRKTCSWRYDEMPIIKKSTTIPDINHTIDVVHPAMGRLMWDFAQGGGFCGEWTPPGSSHCCLRRTGHVGAHAAIVAGPPPFRDHVIAWRRAGAGGWRCYVCNEDALYQVGASGIYCERHALQANHGDDTWDRIHCPLAGKPPHLWCGWCSRHEGPKFECVCDAPAAPVTAHEVLTFWTKRHFDTNLSKETKMARKLDEFVDPSNATTYRVVLNHDNFPIVEKRASSDALGAPVWAPCGGTERHDALSLCALRVAAGVAAPDPILSPKPTVE